AMRGKYRHGVRRHFGKLLDKHRALLPEALDDVLVVHDLVAHIDRRAVLLERALDDLDGAHDAGAEATRLGENDLHRAARLVAIDITSSDTLMRAETARNRWNSLITPERVLH